MKALHTIIALLLITSISSISIAQIKTFSTPGATKFEVPKGVTTLSVYLYGPGGWGGGKYGSLTGYGGKGGLVSGDIPVKEGELLLIIVGRGGSPGQSGTLTGIMRGTEYLAIAGAGGNGSIQGGRGGSGGPNGAAGSIGSGNYRSGNAGTGATTTTGGRGGSSGESGISGTNGKALTGGTNNAKAKGEGWGGGGWYGGGAAGTYKHMLLTDDPYASGGGGGGSNYTKGLTGTITNNSNGSVGGTGSNTGINGMVQVKMK